MPCRTKVGRKVIHMVSLLPTLKPGCYGTGNMGLDPYVKIIPLLDGVKASMDNRQPSRLGETLRVPDDAVHRLDGNGGVYNDKLGIELRFLVVVGLAFRGPSSPLRYSRQTSERTVR